MRQTHYLLLAVACAPVLAQDMIGTSPTGQIYAFDSFTGSIAPLGTGLPGQYASCRDDHGRIWSTTSNTLSVLDPTVPNATVPLPAFAANLRGLANGGAQWLWGVEDGAPDVLVRIDKVSGTKFTIGPTGYNDIEGLENYDNRLYAWDTVHGLLQINTSSGVATDVNPALGTGGAQIAFLTGRMDGRLIGGRNALYVIDTATGTATQYANLGGADLNGADAWQTYTRSFGSACNGVFGPAALGVALTGGYQKAVTVQSGNHAANAVGATIFGVDDTSSGGFALPLLLDPLLGTAGCTLYTSTDASAFGVAGAAGPANLTFQYTLPHVQSVQSFFVQQVVLEPVSGGMSLSNAVLVQIGN